MNGTDPTNGYERACPACGLRAIRARKTATTKKSISGDALVVARCSCGALFQPTVPSAEALARWYDYMGNDARNVQSSPLLERRLQRIVEGFAGSRMTGRLLEIGCGGGLFVRAATARGWEVWGTEISPSCAAMLAPAMGSRLHQGSVETSPFPAGSFDGAVMIEVVEHLTDPFSYLQAVQRLLRPGGRLFLTTPNARGASGRVLGMRWRTFADEHLSFFDRSSLPRLLERAGFGDIEVETTNLDLVHLARDLVRRIRIRRPHGASSAPTPQRIDSARPPARTSSVVRVRVVDLSIEALNQLARATRLGDTLRIGARRR